MANQPPAGGLTEAVAGYIDEHEAAGTAGGGARGRVGRAGQHGPAARAGRAGPAGRSGSTGCTWPTWTTACGPSPPRTPPSWPRPPARLGLPCTVERADLTGRAAQRDRSIESAARRARYAFLGRCAAQTGCQYIATGHQQDDQVETVLHRLVRGTGLEGLRGIPPRRPHGPGRPLARPAAAVRSREDIVAYLSQRGTPGARMPLTPTPSTPATVSATNSCRYCVSGSTPGVDHAIVRLATVAQWAGQWMDELARQTLEALTIDRGDRHVTLWASGLLRRGPWPASLAIRLAIEELGTPLQRIGLEQVRACWSCWNARRRAKCIYRTACGQAVSPTSWCWSGWVPAQLPRRRPESMNCSFPAGRRCRMARPSRRRWRTCRPARRWTGCGRSCPPRSPVRNCWTPTGWRRHWWPGIGDSGIECSPWAVQGGRSSATFSAPSRCRPRIAGICG